MNLYLPLVEMIVLLAEMTTGHLNLASRCSMTCLPIFRKAARDLKGVLMRMYLLLVPSAWENSTSSAELM